MSALAWQALNEKKTDIRIQFKYPINTLFDDISPNELVLRVSPDESIYLKMTTKEPGIDGGNRHTELDLTYKSRFKEEMQDLPDAYERLILDVIRGDHNLFVRADELAAAWRIFTPLLHAIENDKVTARTAYTAPPLDLCHYGTVERNPGMTAHRDCSALLDCGCVRCSSRYRIRYAHTTRHAVRTPHALCPVDSHDGGCIVV
jgi:hypothetical protein